MSGFEDPSSEEDDLTRRARKRVGSVLRGKWKLDSLLGVGGMASVFAATHRNGKRGAVKLLHLELSTIEDARQRFLREGYVANKVDHPGAVSVLDDDVTETGEVYLVMELLEGESLEACARRRPLQRLNVGEVLAIGTAVLDILASAHEKGIVHRDIKPENLFLTKRGEVKLLDFGIARLREMANAANATRTGAAMGTPSFMPPEQALGNWSSVDGRTDLWAFGATLFNLLTGRLVHDAESVNKLLLSAMTKPAPPIASVMPGVPVRVAHAIDRALAFEQNDRWPDARAMREALALASEGLPSALPVAGAAPAVVAPVRPSSSPLAETVAAGDRASSPASAGGTLALAPEAPPPAGRSVPPVPLEAHALATGSPVSRDSRGDSIIFPLTRPKSKAPAILAVTVAIAVTLGAAALVLVRGSAPAPAASSSPASSAQAPTAGPPAGASAVPPSTESPMPEAAATGSGAAPIDSAGVNAASSADPSSRPRAPTGRPPRPAPRDATKAKLSPASAPSGGTDVFGNY